MLHLDPLNKVMVMAGAAAAVVVTILMVVCFVGDGCLFHDLITSKKKRQGRKLSGALYGAADTHGVSLTGYSGCGRKDMVHIPSRQQSLAHSLNEKSEGSLLSRLGSKSCRDSTYSSMSSGRTSPSSTKSLKASNSHLADLHSPEKISPPGVTFSVVTNIIPDSNTLKLAIAVESANDLPARDYGAHPDPWVSVTVLCEKRSIRKRPATSLAYFRTKAIRHAHNPVFSQTFIADIQREEMKNISLLFTVMDQDRYCGPVEMGHSSISMKEAKQTVPEPEKFSITQFIDQVKKPCGELLFGLSYLPTAQRLSFTLIKINNIKETKTNEEDTLNPYLRIMMFSQSGRLVKKKKTTVKVNTKDPVFNETINFEVGPGQLDSSRFLVTLWSRRQELEMGLNEESGEAVNHDSSDQEGPAGGYNTLGYERNGRRDSKGKIKDLCLGRIALGRGVLGEKERDHYKSVCETPRQVFSMWHSLT